MRTELPLRLISRMRSSPAGTDCEAGTCCDGGIVIDDAGITLLVCARPETTGRMQRSSTHTSDDGRIVVWDFTGIWSGKLRSILFVR
jgi:hypothetical protein